MELLEDDCEGGRKIEGEESNGGVGGVETFCAEGERVSAGARPIREQEGGGEMMEGTACRVPCIDFQVHVRKRGAGCSAAAGAAGSAVGWKLPGSIRFFLVELAGSGCWEQEGTPTSSSTERTSTGKVKGD